MVFHEHVGRSLLKALTYRFIILISDSAIIFLITRRVDITIGIIGVSNIASTLIYFVHERAWNHVHWGREKRENSVGS
jgi:uncharacterized membrane protein